MAPADDSPSAPGDDSALMRRVQTGDETAFAELMQRWELPVKALIARVVLNSAEAEDLAQETFVRLWQHRDRYDTTRPFRPWILGIAMNLARNRLRWWRRRPSVSLDEWTEPPEDRAAAENRGARGIERRERAGAVRDAVAALPPQFREALALFEYERLSYAEIAESLRLPVKTVENRILRARERLRSALGNWW